MNFWTLLLCTMAFAVGVCSSAEIVKIEDDWFPLTIIHLNDMHAR
jgi:2',3'-cyclic-nucleotide 2'-phosphodiesterase (5'-nucleotidase family)